MGVTLLAVPVGVTGTQFIPGRCVTQVSVGYASGGTLAFVQGFGVTAANGYIVGMTEVVNINGPCTFFLAAAGSTSVARILLGYSSGYSLTP